MSSTETLLAVASALMDDMPSRPVNQHDRADRNTKRDEFMRRASEATTESQKRYWTRRAGNLSWKW